tara:strand:- start:2105 stop:3100 length:996 start_codon:yes stop_codon:yes gene_type:complete
MKKILITGGTGSFGQAFARRLLALPPVVPGGITFVGDLHSFAPPISHSIERIAIYARGEHQHETMARELTDERLRFFVGDVRDRDRLELAMRGIDTVIHAAALKVVPIAEYNPTECIATNVTGAENVIKAALRTGVERVVALSTDKAVNPINLYGASKLAAEKIFVAANSLSGGSCRFSVVRYGNVVGSRGSVIPLFKRLKEEGKPLPITDVNMTRFWITMDQAVDLVIRTLDTMRGREIIIPKIPSMKVVDLAEAIDPGGERVIVGIRPGEKIHETLISEDEARVSAEFDGYYCVGDDFEKYTGPKKAYTSNNNDQWLSVEQLSAIIRRS